MKPDDTIICRCEGVTCSQISDAIQRRGADSVNQIKKLTRAGMGLCQGRTCSGLVALILERNAANCRQTPPRGRPPLRSVPLKWLADTAGAYAHPSGPTAAVASLAVEDDG